MYTFYSFFFLYLIVYGMSIYFYFILFEHVSALKFLLVGFLLDYFKVTKKKFIFFLEGREKVIII